MKIVLSRTTIFFAALLAAAGAAIAINTWWDNMEVVQTGTVFDATDGKPMEGAYVLAQHLESGGSWGGHSSTWCVRTEGMFTGPGGKFSFRKKRKKHPWISAIKPQYVQTNDVDYLRHLSLTRESYDNDIFLQPQDPANPAFRSPFCMRPKTKEDAAANVVFLKIELADVLRYGNPRGKEQTLLPIISELETSP